MNQEEHWEYTLREWKEPLFSQLLSDALSQSPVVIYDIGACVGAWASLVTNPNIERHVVCFEPSKDNYDFIVKKDLSVVPLNFGIWYGADSAQVGGWGDGNVGGRFIQSVFPSSPHTGETFELRTLESLELPLPDLVKLDVEGAEKNIIGHSTLLRKVPQIIVEWHFPAENAPDFFMKYLPHKVVAQIENGMFLLRL